MTDTLDRQAPAVVRREPLTYEKHLRVSYFKDLFFRSADPAAEARLQRHGQEMDVLEAEQAAEAARGLRREMEPGGVLEGLELRTTPNTTQGTGGYFTPPKWLNEMFATFPRAPRVLANLVPTFSLPGNVGAISLPRLTAGNAAVPTAPNAPDGGNDITDTGPTSAVVTIDGKGDFPKQLLEQPPAGAHLDWAMFKDLSEAYDAQLEYQLMFGIGTGVYNDPQLLGATNVAGIDKESFTTATPFYCSSATPTNNLNTYMGASGSAVGNNRKLPPQAILMTTSRWLWIATSTDNQNRPIVPPDVHPPAPGDGNGGAVSTLAGFPVYVDDAIPATLGAGANQDAVIFCRPSDIILLEGSPKVMVTEEALSGTLGVRCVLSNYVAALTGRYPSGISWITGTGLVPPVFTTAH